MKSRLTGSWEVIYFYISSWLPVFTSCFNPEVWTTMSQQLAMHTMHCSCGMCTTLSSQWCRLRGGSDRQWRGGKTVAQPSIFTPPPMWISPIFQSGLGYLFKTAKVGLFFYWQSFGWIVNITFNIFRKISFSDHLYTVIVSRYILGR